MSARGHASRVGAKICRRNGDGDALPLVDDVLDGLRQQPAPAQAQRHDGWRYQDQSRHALKLLHSFQVRTVSFGVILLSVSTVPCPTRASTLHIADPNGYWCAGQYN